jgi:ubiquinone/menaquinone biosynthesis C-methylase UbiE
MSTDDDAIVADLVGVLENLLFRRHDYIAGMRVPMNSHSSQDDLQTKVEQFWDAKPCDSDTSTKKVYSAEYFNDIENQRYRQQSHVMDLLTSLSFAGKRVLEIGSGVGTDARTIINSGGIYTGINVDAGSCEMTRRSLEIFNLPGMVQQVSALNLPYPDDTFDIVYSFGVLHHIPDVDTAVGEIRRVLKPGGRLVIMLYNRRSINYMVEIRHLRKWGVEILGLPRMLGILEKFGLPRAKLQRHRELRESIGRMSEDEWLSRNTDGPDNPYTRVYDARQAVELLSGFSEISQCVRFFDYTHWGLLGRCLPPRMRRVLGNKWGWHRVVEARKSSA